MIRAAALVSGDGAELQAILDDDLRSEETKAIARELLNN